jgi:predicted ATPase/transcriptional regulator with XRE-family HTH domain
MQELETITFAEVLRRRRLEAGFSQEDLAERAGLSPRSISDLERGQRSVPRLETVRMLSDALDLSPAQRTQLIAASRPELGANATARDFGASEDEGGGPQPAGLARHALPIPPTKLVGREGELDYLLGLFRNTEARLINLTGEGGVGKTRLALALAEQIAVDFADGVAFVDLALLSDADQVAPAIARATGVVTSAIHSPLESVRAALRERQILLVLDNFEHLIAAANVAAELLSYCAGVKILATSRERLHIRGEHVVPVRPLEIPASPDHWPGGSVPDLQRIPATQLFLDRAREVNFGFDLIKEDPRTIVGVCRKLEGLPLAIELAAARTRTLPISVLLNRLDHPLPELSSGPRDLPERQRTLRNTISWSYELLSPDEQAMFRRLAVFAGGAPLDAIGAVINAASGLDLDPVDGVNSLTDKSLVRASHTPAEPRVTMLETIRRFSGERLDQAGEAASTREAHALWYHDLARAAERDLRFGIDQARWFAVIDRELGNIRAALEWFRSTGNGVLLVQLASALDEYWFSHSRYAEVLAWLQAGFGLDPDVTDVVEGWALCTAASGARILGDLELAISFVDWAMLVARRSADDFLLGRTMLAQAAIHQFRSEWEDAALLCERAIPHFKAVGAQNYHALMFVEIGHMRHLQGDLAAAAASIDEGVALMRTTGDHWATAMALEIRGHLAIDAGDLAVAAGRLREAIAIGRQVGDERTVLGAFIGVVRLALATNHPRQAAHLLGAADARQQSGVGLPTTTRPSVIDAQQRAEHDIGVVTFQIAFQGGQATPFDEALAEGLSLLDDLSLPGNAAPGSC